MFLRNKLPEHHLGGATKDVVRLGSGLIGTIAALVLGLLIASARNLLRRGVVSMADRVWRQNGSNSRKAEPFETSAAALSFYDEILKSSPQNETQRSLESRAIDTVQRPGKDALAAVR